MQINRNCFEFLKWVIRFQGCIHHWLHQRFCLYSLETIFVTKQYLPKVELHPLPGNIRLLNLISGSNGNQWCFELQPSRYFSHLGYRLWCPTAFMLFKHPSRYPIISLHMASQNRWHNPTHRHRLEKSECIELYYPLDRLVTPVRLLLCDYFVCSLTHLL